MTPRYHAPLSEALDEVRRNEYRMLAGKDRTFIKGQRYTLLLGLVEGLNNKIRAPIRALQRRAYGYRDEDYLKLKIVAVFLPSLTHSAERDPP